MTTTYTMDYSMIEILRDGLPRIGMAKIGANSLRSSSRRGAPIKYDHIELTTLGRDKHGRLIPDVRLMQKMIADGCPTCGGCERSNEIAEQFNIPEIAEQGLPTSIPVMVPWDDLKAIFPNRLAMYQGGTAVCTGNGLEAMRRPFKGTKTVDDYQVKEWGDAERYGPCGNDCPDLIERRCKPQGRLRFVLSDTQTVGGCYEFKTTSWASVANIVHGLKFIQTITGGPVRWIPLLFEVAAQTVTPRNGAPNTAYIARLTYKGTPQQLLESAQAAARILGPMKETLKALEAGAMAEPIIAEEEVEEFLEEFHPENLEAETPEPVAPPPIEPAPITPDIVEPERSPDHAEVPPDQDAPAIETPEPEAEPTHEPRACDPTKPINNEEQLMLWHRCQATAKGQGCESSKVLRSVLDELGVKVSRDIRLEQIHEALLIAQNWTVKS